MKPHPTDPVSLVFGAVFLAVAVLWLVTRFVALSWPMLAGTVAAGLVLLGVAGVGHALLRARRDSEL